MIKEDDVKNLKVRCLNDINSILEKYNLEYVRDLNIENLSEYDKGLFEVASRVLVMCHAYQNLN